MARQWEANDQHLKYGVAAKELTLNRFDYGKTVKNHLLTASTMARQW
jgi:hypothetical protein